MLWNLSSVEAAEVRTQGDGVPVALLADHGVAGGAVLAHPAVKHLLKVREHGVLTAVTLYLT